MNAARMFNSSKRMLVNRSCAQPQTSSAPLHSANTDSPRRDTFINTTSSLAWHSSTGMAFTNQGHIRNVSFTIHRTFVAKSVIFIAQSDMHSKCTNTMQRDQEYPGEKTHSLDFAARIFNSSRLMFVNRLCAQPHASSAPLHSMNTDTTFLDRDDVYKSGSHKNYAKRLGVH